MCMYIYIFEFKDIFFIYSYQFLNINIFACMTESWLYK